MRLMVNYVFCLMWSVRNVDLVLTKKFKQENLIFFQGPFFHHQTKINFLCSYLGTLKVSSFQKYTHGLVHKILVWNEMALGFEEMNINSTRRKLEKLSTSYCVSVISTHFKASTPKTRFSEPWFSEPLFSEIFD